MYTLTTDHAAHPATLTADTLAGLLPLIEEYAAPHTPEFSYQTGQGYIWWDDQETGFTDNGGEDAVNVGGDPEDGESPEWVHTGPKPATIDAVRAYAAYVLDGAPRNIEIRED